MSPARKDVNIAIQEFAKLFKPGQKVLFVGVDTKWDYKSLFNCTYETMDIKPSRHPDILADIQNCPQIEENTYDGIIMTGVYEYLEDPYMAMDEIETIIKPGGKILICMPGKAYYGDKKPYMTLLRMNAFFYGFKIQDINITYYRSNIPYYFQVFATI